MPNPHHNHIQNSFPRLEYARAACGEMMYREGDKGVDRIVAGEAVLFADSRGQEKNGAGGRVKLKGKGDSEGRGLRGKERA